MTPQQAAEFLYQLTRAATLPADVHDRARQAYMILHTEFLPKTEEPKAAEPVKNQEK